MTSHRGENDSSIPGIVDDTDSCDHHDSTADGHIMKESDMKIVCSLCNYTFMNVFPNRFHPS